MTVIYTDVFSSLDGFGSHSGGDWGGYWGKQGPELLGHRLALYDEQQRLLFGPSTFRQFAQQLASGTEKSEVGDPWVTRMRTMPATVVSATLEGPLNWPDATIVRSDAVDVVARLKEESEVPLRSHGSLSMNRARARTAPRSWAAGSSRLCRVAGPRYFWGTRRQLLHQAGRSLFLRAGMNVRAGLSPPQRGRYAHVYRLRSGPAG